MSSEEDEDDFFGDVSDSGNESSDEDELMGATGGVDDEGGTGPSGSSAGPDLDEFTFSILSTEEIVEHMVDSIRDVASVLEIPSTYVRVLLNHFKWDKEKLMERFYTEDQERIFSEAKIQSPWKLLPSSSSSSGSQSIKGPPTCECQICFMTLPTSMMSGLSCGHLFCVHCWSEYLTTKIMSDGAASHGLTCPASKCGVLVDDHRVIELFREKEPRIKSKFQYFITSTFVQCNRLMRWCPSPDCTHAVRVHHVEARPVKCRCGHVFCFACGHNWHDPVRCHVIAKWVKKCDDDSETSNWISANTKECPKCGATIEKDGGCNHMVCKNQACRGDFCWVCLGPWEPHGSSWYHCNRYNEEEARNAREGQEKSRAALQRYLFYCNRYMNHLQSLKFENKLYATVKDKMEEMQRHGMSWIEVQFLRKAVDILCECRQTLMYTYVLAFYLVKNNQAEIFEVNQEDLENSTEVLSEYLERDISADNIADIKQKVQDKYRYCDSRRKVLLAHVHEGYDKDWWQYTELDIK